MINITIVRGIPKNGRSKYIDAIKGADNECAVISYKDFFLDGQEIYGENSHLLSLLGIRVLNFLNSNKKLKTLIIHAPFFTVDSIRATFNQFYLIWQSVRINKVITLSRNLPQDAQKGIKSINLSSPYHSYQLNWTKTDN